jgi:hypothetical protein
LEIRNEAGRRLRCSLREPLEGNDLILGETTAVTAILQAVAGFLQLAVGVPQIANEVTRQISAESFRHRAWRICGGAP